MHYSAGDFCDIWNENSSYFAAKLVLRLLRDDATAPSSKVDILNKWGKKGITRPISDYLSIKDLHLGWRLQPRIINFETRHFMLDAKVFSFLSILFGSIDRQNIVKTRGTLQQYWSACPSSLTDTLPKLKANLKSIKGKKRESACDRKRRHAEKEVTLEFDPSVVGDTKVVFIGRVKSHWSKGDYPENSTEARAYDRTSASVHVDVP